MRCKLGEEDLGLTRGSRKFFMISRSSAFRMLHMRASCFLIYSCRMTVSTCSEHADWLFSSSRIVHAPFAERFVLHSCAKLSFA